MKKILLVIIIAYTHVYILSAQDFDFEYYQIFDFRSLGFNYSLQQFSPRSANTLPDSQRITFATNLSSLEYRELNVRVSIGYQSYVLNGTIRTSFSVYAESSNDISFLGKAERNGFFLPIILSANYVKAEPPTTIGAKNFEIGSLGIGTGLKYRYFTRSFGFVFYSAGAFHYATQGFSTEYGSSTTFISELQMIFQKLFFDGVVVGYRFHTQQWNMNSAVFDYKRYYHGPFIGIMF